MLFIYSYKNNFQGMNEKVSNKEAYITCDKPSINEMNCLVYNQLTESFASVRKYSLSQISVLCGTLGDGMCVISTVVTWAYFPSYMTVFT